MTESKNPIKKTVPASGSAVFTKEETAHDPSEIAPIGWQLYIKAPNIPNCRYMISLQNDQCVETEGEGDCALVSECGDCCFHFEIKAQ